MTKYEYVKQEIECLKEETLKELYNDYALAIGYGLIYDNTRWNIIEFCNNDLETYLNKCVGNSKYNPEHRFYTINWNGKIESFNWVSSKYHWELQEVVEWIDSNDLYDRYEDMFDYYEGCEEEEEE